jgi:poly(A) polymerase
VKLPDATWQKRPGMEPLLDALGVEEGLTRYVGGCVRDTLLDLAVSDVDLATRLEPTQVMRRLQEARIKAVPTGLAHGTVTAVSAGQPVEVTTLRRDVSTDGRHATIAFTDDWREDAARRDFTINALSADPATGELFDYFGGLADLEERRVRFIGDPLQRIAEDHLRILRFFRFHARFGRGAAPDADALAACTARANDLMALSRERIADELMKLLALSDPAPTAALMEQAGIFRPVLPEIDAAGARRLARMVGREAAAGTPADPLRRMAALLPQDAAAAEAIAQRLRLSNRATKRIAAALTGREPMPPQQLAYWTGPEAAADAILLGDGEPGDVHALKDWARPRLPMGGGELIAMGLPPGPLVARTLGQVERQWVAEGFPGRDRVQSMARAQVDQALRSSQ